MTSSTMASCCNKQRVMLAWGLMECLFFTGLLSGWHLILPVLKQERFFAYLCASPANSSNQSEGAASFSHVTREMAGRTTVEPLDESNVTILFSNHTKDRATIRNAYTSKFSSAFNEPNVSFVMINDSSVACDHQDEALSWVYLVASFLTGLLAFPCGLLYDIRGTLKIRILAIFMFTTSTLMMAFTSEGVSWLLYPTWSFLGLSGLLVLITNIQVANLFRHLRATLIFACHSASDASAFLMLMVKGSSSAGLNIQSSFMFLTVSIVPLLIGTIAFLPKTRIPWPLPEHYRERRDTLKQYIGANNLCRRTRSDTSMRSRSGSLSALVHAGIASPLYISQVLWLSVLNLRLKLSGGLPGGPIFLIANGDNHLIDEKLQLVVVLCTPVFGLILDKHFTSETEEQRRYVILVKHALLASILWLLTLVLSALPLVDIPHTIYAIFILQTALRVLLAGSHTAYIYTLFPHSQFGRFFGLSLALAMVVAALEHPLRTLSAHAQVTHFQMNVACLVMVALVSFHPLLIWRYRKSHMFPTHAHEMENGLRAGDRDAHAQFIAMKSQQTQDDPAS